MRYYFPEPPRFRLIKQKPDCLKLTMHAPVALGRDAPKSKDDIAREQSVKQASAKEPPRPNARAHRVLDQIDAVHRWWTAPAPAKAISTEIAPPAEKAATPTEKPLELLDLQDLPDAEHSIGYKLNPALMRKWFGNPAFAVESEDQKACMPDAPFYPTALVDATTLKLAELLKVKRIQAAFDKIKSSEFLGSKAVRDALYKVCSKLPAGCVDVDPMTEFGGDLQKMHRRYAFASVTVGKRFRLEDIRVQDLDKSGEAVDDVALALGEFRLYVAIQDAHVFYNGRTSRRVQVKEVAIYIMAPYGFDAFGPDVPYLGHFNKKRFALVTDGDWVNAPVYTGRDLHAKNAVLRPATKPLFIQWRQMHKKGGDMLLFSDRRPSFPNLDVVVPIQTINPTFKIVGRLAGNFAGYIGVPFPDLHLALLIYNTSQGMIGIDGQPTGKEAGYANAKKIRSNFYYNTEPTKIIFTFDLNPVTTMNNEELANRFITAAQNFASYVESYSVPEGWTGETMKQGEYNSGSYLSGLLHSVLGYVPQIDFSSKALQAPGWDMPLPDSYFKGEAIK